LAILIVSSKKIKNRQQMLTVFFGSGRWISFADPGVGLYQLKRHASQAMFFYLSLHAQASLAL
jgi:hypothetical protein